MRSHASLIAAALAVMLAGSAAADCIDYRDYLHWVGSVDTPGEAYGVDVSGDYAFIADNRVGGLQIIDITDRTSPEIISWVDTPPVSGSCRR